MLTILNRIQTSCIVSTNIIKSEDTSTLSTLLEEIKKNKSTNPSDYTRLNLLLDKKLKNFNANIVEIGQFISDLDSLISWRSTRLKTAIANTGKKMEAASKYIFCNYAEVERSLNKLPNIEFINLIPTAHRESIIRAWEEPSSFNLTLSKTFYNSLQKIEKEITTNISRSPQYQSSITFFSPLEKIIHETKNPGLLSSTYNKNDLENFNKTIYYLSSQPTAEKALYLTYLFNLSVINYKTNDTHINSMLFIKNRKGDCGEMGSLFYSILATQGKSHPEFYEISFKTIESLHGAGAVKIGDMFYVYDNARVGRGESFAKAIENCIGKGEYINTIQKVNPRSYFFLQEQNLNMYIGKPIIFTNIRTIEPK